MHIGNKELAKDGVVYRSSLERQFVDKFLFGKYSYEYEKPYKHGTAYTCDFYIDKLNLWVEVVPYEQTTFQLVEEIPEGIIHLNVPFKHKEVAKENGARWDQKNKKWYIFKEDVNRFKNNRTLKQFLPTFNVQKPSDSKTENFSEYYQRITRKKEIVENNYKQFFCTIHEEDLRSESLGHILCGKFPTSGWKFFNFLEQNCL